MKAILIITMLLSGCATITRGSHEALVIETDPLGADVRLSNGLTCTTPCSLNVKRRGEIIVTINRDGYEPVSSIVTSSVDGTGAAGMAGNVLFGGLIGLAVDGSSGAMHSHKPNPLVVKLIKVTDDI